ncbi:hypothetical protein COCMIDRAFT_28022 [Bipolaris oryzae ATCC 44560]|uniref:Uncharacterized protein n=1 Tax=Bipolaris oryzae ATCC 44560 TaxID=930090 RepID=W6ZIS9_COCMI|nr:uncharacterized protein COCMIDRAFT_28022 [Bipolaris oryzae ATCC 44560]EUC43496.1 hypothetical protein COCMIDRAFT_28022 [Bipolaris oryzae ATCC 44560]
MLARGTARLGGSGGGQGRAGAAPAEPHEQTRLAAPLQAMLGHSKGPVKLAAPPRANQRGGILHSRSPATDLDLCGPGRASRRPMTRATGARRVEWQPVASCLPWLPDWSGHLAYALLQGPSLIRLSLPEAAWTLLPSARLLAGAALPLVALGMACSPGGPTRADRGRAHRDCCQPSLPQSGRGARSRRGAEWTAAATSC